jgi:hypothetical protein
MIDLKTLKKMEDGTVEFVYKADKKKILIFLIILILYIIYLVELVKKYGKSNESIFYSIYKRASFSEKAIFVFSTGFLIGLIISPFFSKGTKFKVSTD